MARSTSEEIEAALLAALRPVEFAGLAGITLLTPGPDAGIGDIAARHGAGAPYWAYAWPGGQALALYLRDHPELVRGRSVVDFGCGGGLVAIAAAQAGARHVMAYERDPVARSLAGLNARANGVLIEVVAQMVPIGAAEIVLAGDVFYAPDIARASQAVLVERFRTGAVVRVGDPGRPDFPSGYSQIASYPVAEIGKSGPQKGMVYQPAPPSA